MFFFLSLIFLIFPYDFPSFSSSILFFHSYVNLPSWSCFFSVTHLSIFFFYDFPSFSSPILFFHSYVSHPSRSCMLFKPLLCLTLSYSLSYSFYLFFPFWPFLILKLRLFQIFPLHIFCSISFYFFFYFRCTSVTGHFCFILFCFCPPLPLLPPSS